MKGPRVTGGHHSGKATASEAQWFALLEQMRDEGADRFSVTEANGDRARRAIERWCRLRRWQVVQSPAGRGAGMGECAILYDPSVFRVEEADWLLLTDLTLRTARKAPIYAALAKFRHLASGPSDWWTVAHLPAHLEGRKGFRHGWPSKVHRAAVRGWREALRERGIMRDATVLGDFNLNLRLAWVRVWVKATWPTLRSAWRRPYPRRRGTFHRRIIDWALSGIRTARKAWLLDPVDGFDHDGFLFVQQLRKARR